MDFTNLKKKLMEAGHVMKDTAQQQQINTQDPTDPAFIPGESNGLMGVMGAIGKLQPDPIELPESEFAGHKVPGMKIDPGAVMGSMKLVGGLGEMANATKAANAASELTSGQKALQAIDKSAEVPMTMNQLRMITQKKSRLLDMLKKNPAAK